MSNSSIRARESLIFKVTFSVTPILATNKRLSPREMTLQLQELSETSDKENPDEDVIQPSDVVTEPLLDNGLEYVAQISSPFPEDFGNEFGHSRTPSPLPSSLSEILQPEEVAGPSRKRTIHSEGSKSICDRNIGTDLQL